MASITIPLLLRWLDDSQTLYIIDDGSLLDADEETANGWGKNVCVLRRRQREDEIRTKLARYESCTQYREVFPLAHKLLDLPLLAQHAGHDRFLYADSDILFLRGCQGLLQIDTNVHLRTDAVKLSVKLSDVFLKFGWKIPYRFNSGYFSYPAHAFDWDFVEHFLGQPKCRHFTWLTEQTCWAVLFGRLPHVLYPDPEQFVCREDCSGPNSDTRAIHLIGQLKCHVDEWSVLASENPTGNELRLLASRYVTLNDWLHKSLQRFGTKLGR